MASHLGVPVGALSPDREGTFYFPAPAALQSRGHIQTDPILTYPPIQSKPRLESHYSGTNIGLFRQHSANSHFQPPNNGYGSMNYYSPQYSEFPAAQQWITSFTGSFNHSSPSAHHIDITAEPGRGQMLIAPFTHSLPDLPAQTTVLGFGDQRRPEVNQYGHHQALVPTGNGISSARPFPTANPKPCRPQFSQELGSVPYDGNNSKTNAVDGLDSNFRQIPNFHAATTPLSGHEQMQTRYDQAVVSTTGQRLPDLNLRAIEQPLVFWTDKATHSHRGPYKKVVQTKSSNSPSQPSLPLRELSGTLDVMKTVISSMDQEEFDFKCPFKSCPQSTQRIKRICDLRAHLRDTHKLDRTEISRLTAEAIRTASKDILKSNEIEVIRQEALKLREENRLAYAEVASSKMGQNTKTECERMIDNRKCGKTFALKVIQEQAYDKSTNKAICHGCVKADNDPENLDNTGHKFLAINGHYSSDWFKVYESYRTYEVKRGTNGGPKVPDFACLLVARMAETADRESTAIPFLQSISSSSQHSASQEPIVSWIQTDEHPQAVTKTPREVHLEAKIKALEAQVAGFAQSAAGSRSNPVNVEHSEPSTSAQRNQLPVPILDNSAECAGLQDAFLKQLDQESSQDVATSISRQTPRAKRKISSDEMATSQANQEPADNRNEKSPSKDQSPSGSVEFLGEVAPEPKKLKKDKDIHNHKHKEAKGSRTKFRHVSNKVSQNEIKNINNAANMAVGKNNKYSWMDPAKKPLLPRDYARESSNSHSSSPNSRSPHSGSPHSSSPHSSFLHSSSPESIHPSSGGSFSSLGNSTTYEKNTTMVEESNLIENSEENVQEEFEAEQDDLFTDFDQYRNGWFEQSNNEDVDGERVVEYPKNGSASEEMERQIAEFRRVEQLNESQEGVYDSEDEDGDGAVSGYGADNAQDIEQRKALERELEEALMATLGEADLVEDTEMAVAEDCESVVSEEE